jgi:hypothetical protein
MTKVHTRQLRKLRYKGAPKEPRTARSRSFNSEDAANAYAKENGIKNYKLVDAQPQKSTKNKIKIVVE